MAAVRHLGFWNLQFCHVAFVSMPFCFLIQYCDEIRQSVDELWPKKAIFKIGAAAILNSKKMGHVTVIGFNIWCSVPNCIKIGRFFTEIWRFNDFQNGSRSPSWILKICSFCHVAIVYIPFCFLKQNVTEIRQSVDKLWPKKRFSRWRPPPSWILKISILGHVTVIGFNIWCSVPNFIKIGRFLTEIWWFSDLQNGGRPPSWIFLWRHNTASPDTFSLSKYCPEISCWSVL